MPSSLWRGAISFGLVSIPIRVVTATEDRSISFRRVHLKDMGRVRNQKTCELDGQVVPEYDIGKGYEIARDQLVEVTDDDLYDMPLPTARAIEIVAFVNSDEIDPVRLSSTYYLAADGAVAARPYTLLREALRRSSKVAIAKFALRGRERLGLMTIRDWPCPVRTPPWRATSAECGGGGGPAADRTCVRVYGVEAAVCDTASRPRTGVMPGRGQSCGR